MGQLTLILGGARSGKSDHAMRLAQTPARDVLFVATAQPVDEEMRVRIAQHRRQRPSHWRTVEAPTGIVNAITGEAASYVLVDCLTVLVSNLLVSLGDEPSEEAAEDVVTNELDALLRAVEAPDERHWIIVSNEVGLGIVPHNHLARLYRDVLGRANQRLAAAAHRVIFMVAGVPMEVKGDK